jgi:hypothetical protein
MFSKWKIVLGDKVILRSGKDKGKIGTVIRVYRKSNKVLVTGVNLKFKKFARDMEKDQPGILNKIISRRSKNCDAPPSRFKGRFNRPRHWQSDPSSSGLFGNRRKG